MSTRAYRVNYLDTEDAPTFNVSDRPQLFDGLSLDPIEGLYETTTEIAQAVIDDLVANKSDITVGELMGLAADIAYADKHQGGILRYECY